MFYNYENEGLIYGECVVFPDGEALLIDFKDKYEYPFRGYYYFDTIELAKEFFNIIDK